MPYSRRQFVRGALALPAATLAVAAHAAAKGTVRLGVQTYSFRDMLATPGDTTDRMIAAMQELGLVECEMFEPMLQPHGLGNAPTGIEAVRQWRLGPGLDEVAAAAAKFKRAGIRVFAFNFGLKDSNTDAEVERGFQMTRAMGAHIMTVSTTLRMAKRTVPFVQRHQILLALHGHSNLSDPEQFATPDSFIKGLAMSPLYRVNLDIGHFSAAGFDPVAFIRQHHARITNLHLKDRKKNNGPNEPFGQGDTPIKPVLHLLQSERYDIPAYIEYEYAGAGTSTEEVRKCLDYVKAALA
jgi:sugar phosphate isomerase/epimerase